ncbi:BZ3500_MvSof-1268-A1-R1_Chr7-1g09066 [Microbotryum saponariae]|uniref:BZ3500_MvSof-1268-A1-R1_Chr7-1g09066 protein n=1 Tax=Microbotryum saponariae TaxID=289078 RepID=A0A2X0MZD8_9BASI|nr:BZ3501_MvSof-1269-A2-R1_Chr7-1g08770 [Microbotryum saponariae]SDA02722.1 BZ3500_MvSof-1268-A1-R1_Chr7-1g09066 [Microbotryum saponariae]
MLSNDEAPPREDSTLICRTCGSSYDRATKATSSSSSASPSSSSSSSPPQDPTTVLPQAPSHELSQPQRSLLPIQTPTPTPTQLLDSLKQLIETYQALNSRTLTELSTFPDALEFSRDFVGVSRPVVIRAGLKGRGGKVDSSSEGLVGREGEVVRALREWDRDYLVRKMGDRKVVVAVSPDGKADSIVRDPKNGKQYFVEPACESNTSTTLRTHPLPPRDTKRVSKTEILFLFFSLHRRAARGPQAVQMNLASLFDHLNTPTNPESEFPTPVYYLQSQNGNLQPNQDLELLLEDVGEEGPEWARQSFGTDPDAVNVWIGDERSETCVHKDPYENIYLVIRGTKFFTLYPPTEFACLGERTFPHARWVLDEPKQEFGIVPTEGVRIPWLGGGKVKRGSIKAEESTGMEELFHSDSDASHLDGRSLLSGIEDLSRPLTVVLNEGDYLYLPSLWFHAVRQEGVKKRDDVVQRKDGEEEDRVVIAVNWWYDMKMHGAGWSMNEFLRAVSRIAVGDQREEERSSVGASSTDGEA